MYAQPLLWSWSGLTVLTLSVVVLFFARRSHQPIKFRGPYLVTISSLGGFIYTTWLVIYLYNSDVPGSAQQATHHAHGRILTHDAFCTMGSWVTWLAYPCLVLPYLLRAYRHYSIFRSERADKLVTDNLFWQKLVMHESYLVKILVGSLVLFAAFEVSKSVFGWEDHLVVGFECESHEPLAWSVIHLLEVAAFAYVVYALWHVSDDYFISQEFALVSAFWGVAALAVFLLHLFAHDTGLHDLFFRDDASALDFTTFCQIVALINIVRNVLTFGVSIVWPVYKTFTGPFVKLWSTCDALRSLDSLLKDIICIQYFRDYLSTVSRLECFLCWMETELYQDIEDPDDLALQAQRIFDKYVRPGAELEVELSVPVRARVASEVQHGQPDADTFRELQHELLLVLDAEFPRFLTSESCRQCLRELERQEHLKSVLEHSGMI